MIRLDFLVAGWTAIIAGATPAIDPVGATRAKIIV
jgi:hypothetical protein